MSGWIVPSSAEWQLEPALERYLNPLWTDEERRWEEMEEHGELNAMTDQALEDLERIDGIGRKEQGVTSQWIDHRYWRAWLVCGEYVAVADHRRFLDPASISGFIRWLTVNVRDVPLLDQPPPSATEADLELELRLGIPEWKMATSAVEAGWVLTLDAIEPRVELFSGRERVFTSTDSLRTPAEVEGFFTWIRDSEERALDGIDIVVPSRT